MDKKLELEREPVIKLLLKYSIPAVIAMIVNAIYNIVDRVFIGKFVSEEALAGLTVDFPIMLSIFAIASLVEVGSASLIAISLGKKQNREASRYFGNSIGLGIIITTLVVIAIFLNMDKLVVFFGAKGTVVNYSKVYLQIILLGINFQTISLILSSTVRVEGQPFLSMIAMITAALTNILLDYIFIVHMEMGVRGAAVATILGQIVGAGILLSFYFRKKSRLKVKLYDFVPSVSLSMKTISIGIATFASIFGTSVSMILLNRELLQYGDTAAITAIGVINSLYAFFIMPIMGIQQGMQPILGYNYGANLLKRVFKTLKLSLIMAISFSTIIFVILEIYPEVFVHMFIEQGSPTIKITVYGLRVMIMMLPLLAINFFGIAFFQSIGKAKIAMILSMLRQFIFLVPIVLVLPKFFGLKGVWFATPIADGLAIIIIGIALMIEYKKEKKSLSLASQGTKIL